ncbi:class F sortase [Streptomyces sp. NPDC014870]|uniref:class F sortase n=1 Tax=Streptomyces sp. NPDC014870 TaxID=3364925 RepID=UPI0036F5FAF9
MARRRYRTSRRQRRHLRLARTVAVTLSLVGGGIWWATDEEPSDPSAAAAAATRAVEPGAAGPPGRAAGERDQKSKAETRAEGGPKGPDARAPAKARPGTAPARPVPSPAPLARSRATDLAIPAITIEAPVMGLGLDGSGQLGSPPIENPRLVGWYEHGPAPGELGTAVVVGHRDTRTGPAIFLNLDSLTPGNTVRVARADGKVAVFKVDKVRTYTKEEFPDQEVYGSTGRPELRLLTCGGSFDAKKGYASNVVVFAHLTDVARTI